MYYSSLYTRFMRRSVRLKLAATLIICCLLVVDIYNNTTKYRHPGQLLVKWFAAPRISIEWPDLLENEAIMNNESGMCPKKPPDIDLEMLHPIDMERVASSPVTHQSPTLALGGHYKPDKCVSRTKAAIIVPYRDRKQHLTVLLNYLVPFLVQQQAEFNIFVIELMPIVAFNRALLLNVGFIEAMRTHNFTCIIFHDVDLLPEADSNLYRCGDHPRHMGVALSAFEYKLPYPEFAGGVMAMKPATYLDVNGHSNLYFGWGGEDDDLIYRLTWKKYPVTRYPDSISRYTSIFHIKASGKEVSNLRYNLLWTAEKRMFEEGLNSLKYTTVKYEKLPRYTRILVDVDLTDYDDAIRKFT